MLRMRPSTLRQAADRLKQAMQDHDVWHEDLLRSIFCGLATDTNDLAPAAHRLCSFGRWFYDEAPNGLRDYPVFAALGKEHQRQHQVAAKMLRAAKADAPIVRDDFEELVATTARLRMHFESLRASIDAALIDRDTLTGAYARARMLPDLHDLHAQCEGDGRPCCLVFVDIDNFKRINDTLGHQVGDAVLCGLVQHLDANLRASDKVFRYGGDEFLLALPGTDLELAQEVVDRLREGLAEKILITVPGESPLRITASFGLALLDVEREVSESISRADQALLLAKAAGRNRAIRWDASINTSTRWRKIDVDQVPD